MIEGFEELAEGQLAGEPSGEQARAFTAHLASCAECRARFEAHRAAAAQLAGLGSAPLAPLSAGFTDAVMKKLPPGPPPGAPAGKALRVAAAVAGTIALVLAAAATRGRSDRPAGSASPASVAAPSASAAPAEPSAAPSPSPSPLPSVARPSASIGGLADDDAGGRSER